MDSTGLLILVFAAALAAIFGLYRQLTDGRLRAARVPADTAGPQFPGLVPDGAPAVVQFSSEFCSSCRSTTRMLGELGQQRRFGYVELDVADHLELTRELNIMRTPTVLVLDADHRVRLTTSGAPTRRAVADALDSIEGTNA